MGYDGNPAAAALEFVRCAFVFFYTQAGIPLLTTALYWSGLTALVGDNLETFLRPAEELFLHFGRCLGLANCAPRLPAHPPSQNEDRLILYTFFFSSFLLAYFFFFLSVHLIFLKINPSADL